MAAEVRALVAPDVARQQRALVTPEGVTLRLELPTAGERIGAFVTDVVLIVLALLGLTLLAFVGALATGRRNLELYGVIWLLGAFILRNFWFIAFETGPRAATPGKRWFRLRVATRDGQPLSPDAVIARNLLRELEFFLPLSALAYRAEDGLADTATALLALGWTALFLVFPLFNRDRLRAGDLIAGTWVVRAPRAPLQSDIPSGSTGGLEFTDAQLDVYGVFELQTLEDLLRRSAAGGPVRPREDPVKTVAETIRKRIGWTGAEDDHTFLTDYYSAVRSRLERQLLFGRRRRDKRDR